MMRIKILRGVFALIRFGIIGTNWITERLLSAIREMDDFSLTAVYSRSEERAREFASKYGAAAIFTDIEQMANSNEMDAVYIASPNSLHAKQAITFLSNGKHVLCEKPMASNTAEVEAMIQAAGQNHVLLMEALKTTFLPNFKSIQENIHKIGRVRRYVANYCKYSSRYDAYKQGEVLNAFNPVFSNGSLMDLGVYGVYPMVVLFGEPVEIKANSVMLESGVDGEGSLLATYRDMEAVIMHSKISDSYVPSEIQGEEGSIIINNISNPDKVEIRYRDGRREDISIKDDKEAMYYEVKEFIDLIKTGQVESNVNSYQHSTITAKILEDARKQFGLYYPADKV